MSRLCSVRYLIKTQQTHFIVLLQVCSHTFKFLVCKNMSTFTTYLIYSDNNSIVGFFTHLVLILDYFQMYVYGLLSQLILTFESPSIKTQQMTRCCNTKLSQKTSLNCIFRDFVTSILIEKHINCFHFLSLTYEKIPIICLTV